MLKKLILIFIFLSTSFFVDAAQFARPDTDITLGVWTEDDAATDALWDEVNETIASDTDYDKVVDANDSLDLGLSTVTDPGVGTGHIVRFRMFGTGAGAAERLIVTLREGGVGVEGSGLQASDGVWGDKSFTISEVAADTITDYSNLSLYITSSGNTGAGGADELRISWAELEVPDVTTFTPRMVWWE